MVIVTVATWSWAIFAAVRPAARTRSPSMSSVAFSKGGAPVPSQAAIEEAFPLPLGRLLRPDEVAEVVLFTVTPATSALAGSVIFCDAGVDAVFHPTSPAPYVSAV